MPRAGDGQISFEELSAFLFEDDAGDAEPDRNYQLAMSAIRKEVEKYTRGSALLRGKAFRSPLYKQNGLTVDELAAKIRGYFKIPLEGADLAAVFKKHDAGTGLFDFEQLCRQRAGGAVREKAQAQIEKELSVTGLDRNWAQLTTEEREHRKQIRRTFGRTQLAGAREGASLPMYRRGSVQAAALDVAEEEHKHRNRADMLRRRLIQRLAAAGDLPELFRRMDHDGNGTLDAAEFRAGIAEDGAMDEAHIKALFKEIDVDGDGTISLHEMEQFLKADPYTGVRRGGALAEQAKEHRPALAAQVAAAAERHTREVGKLRAALQRRKRAAGDCRGAQSLSTEQLFISFDADRNGYIDATELKHILADMGMDCSPGAVHRMMESLQGAKSLDRRISPAGFAALVDGEDGGNGTGGGGGGGGGGGRCKGGGAARQRPPGEPQSPVRLTSLQQREAKDLARVWALAARRQSTADGATRPLQQDRSDGAAGTANGFLGGGAAGTVTRTATYAAIGGGGTGGGSGGGSNDYSAGVRRVLQLLDAYLGAHSMKVLDVFRRHAAQARGEARRNSCQRGAWADPSQVEAAYQRAPDARLDLGQFTTLLHIIGLGVLLEADGCGGGGVTELFGAMATVPSKLQQVGGVGEGSRAGVATVGVTEVNGFMRRWRRAEAAHKQQAVIAQKQSAKAPKASSLAQCHSPTGPRTQAGRDSLRDSASPDRTTMTALELRGATAGWALDQAPPVKAGLLASIGGGNSARPVRQQMHHGRLEDAGGLKEGAARPWTPPARAADWGQPPEDLVEDGEEAAVGDWASGRVTSSRTLPGGLDEADASFQLLSGRGSLDTHDLAWGGWQDGQPFNVKEQRKLKAAAAAEAASPKVIQTVPYSGSSSVPKIKIAPSGALSAQCGPLSSARFTTARSQGAAARSAPHGGRAASSSSGRKGQLNALKEATLGLARTASDLRDVNPALSARLSQLSTAR